MSIDWFTLIVQIINFAVLIALLNHFLYRPISDAISKRNSDIADRLKLAQRRETEASSEKQKYEDLNHQMESQRQLLLDQANEETDSLRKRLMQEARNDVQFRREDWLASLHREQDSIVKQLVQRSSDQVVAISTQALEQLADEDIEERIVERFLNQLGNLPTEERERLRMEADSNPTNRIETAFAVCSKMQQRINQTLQQELGLQGTQFVVNSEIVMGISLRVGGLKTGWNVQEYIEPLHEELQRAMDQ